MGPGRVLVAGVLSRGGPGSLTLSRSSCVTASSGGQMGQLLTTSSETAGKDGERHAGMPPRPHSPPGPPPGSSQPGGAHLPPHSAIAASLGQPRGRVGGCERVSPPPRPRCDFLPLSHLGQARSDTRTPRPLPPGPARALRCAPRPAGQPDGHHGAGWERPCRCRAEGKGPGVSLPSNQGR